MYQEDEEKLTDMILGEAILTLLRNDAPVSNASLIQQLQLMAATEKDTARHDACRCAIDEAENNHAAVRKRTLSQGRDRFNATHFYTREGPPDGVKKH